MAHIELKNVEKAFGKVKVITPLNLDIVDGNLVDGLGAGFEANKIGIRPEHINVSTDNGLWKGTVGVAEHLGSDTFFHVKVNEMSEPLTVRVDGSMEIGSGTTIYLTPDTEQMHRFNTDGMRINL